MRFNKVKYWGQKNPDNCMQVGIFQNKQKQEGGSVWKKVL